jgi:hypothetical protein
MGLVPFLATSRVAAFLQVRRAAARGSLATRPRGAALYSFAAAGRGSAGPGRSAGGLAARLAARVSARLLTQARRCGRC